MASIVLSHIGSSFGNYLMPGLGGKIFSALGRKIGGPIDEEIGWTQGSSDDGPRLENLSVQDSRYGSGLPIVFGQARVAGNIIWASNLIETAHHEDGGIGKGGGSLSGSSRTTYSYSIHCAIALAQGEIGDIATIWADSTVIYQNGVWNAGLVGDARFYKGTMTQEPDSLMEAYVGAGQVPAYRGVAYVVLESFQLQSFGSRLPNLTFEIVPPPEMVEPLWTGEFNADLCQAGLPLSCKSTPPLVIEGGATRARKIIMGGYENLASTATFRVAEYDVTGEAAQETGRAESASFPMSVDPGHSWALSPDGRYVAICINQTTVATRHDVMIYDTQTRRFGEILTLTLPYLTDAKQIAWLDAQRFVMMEAASGKLGLRVFARAGLSVVDLGFYDVWGAGSATSRAPLSYAQFTPMAGGLAVYAGDKWPGFTAIYGRCVVWREEGLLVGEPWTLASGYNSGTANSPQIFLLRTGNGEWTLFYATLLSMKMISFRPSWMGVEVTRPFQSFNNGTFMMSLASHPVSYGSRIVVVQRNAYDSDFRLALFHLEENNFVRGEADWLVQNAPAGSGFLMAAALDRSHLLLMPQEGISGRLNQNAIIPFQKTGDNLASIVRHLLARAGYAASDSELSALEEVRVEGYVLGGPMMASSALGPLQAFYPFDLVESEGQMKAVLRHGASVVDVARDEGVARADEEKTAEPSYQTARVQEMDLPLEVAVDYIDAARDYEIGSQRARRTATHGAKAHVKVNLPIVCSSSDAKKVAEDRLREAWGGRDRVFLRLCSQWLILDPGDVVRCGDREVRIVEIEKNKGSLEIKGTLNLPPRETTAVADGGVYAGQTERAELSSALYLMDIPALRSEDDQPGVYVAMSGTEGWPGGSVWRAWDAVSFDFLAGFDMPAVCGIATNVLADGPCCYKDQASEVYVQLLRGELASCNEAALLGGANAALIGDEILQFQTATLLESGHYRLTGLLRGRKGTATTGHRMGERFVLLSPASLRFLPVSLAERGRSAAFRALTDGQALGEAVDVAFSYGFRSIQPLAPVHLQARRTSGAGSDMTLTWKRCGRHNAAWVDYVDVPLDEAQEAYEVEIMDGANVKRLFAGLSEPSVLYTAAQQSADWGGSVPTAFNVNVYQVGARYGRGAKLSGSV